MKKLFLLLLAILAISPAYAGLPMAPQPDKPVDTSTVIKRVSTATVSVTTMCINGYVFAVATQNKTDTSNGAGGLALTQIFGYGQRPISC